MAAKKLKITRLYAVEEHEIYREAYKAIFSAGRPINLLAISTKRQPKALKDKLTALNPDVLLIGIRKLDSNILRELKEISTYFPRMGVVLLFVFHHAADIPLLRSLAARGKAGLAVFLRQSLDRLDHLSEIVISVSEGQVILDPALTSLLLTEKQSNPLFKGLTTRELEILSLMSKSYTNTAIAEALYINIKTVRHHINNMYSKLKAEISFSGRHLRVRATRLYLETTGELLAPDEPA